MIIDLLAGIALFVVSNNSNQDAAGRGLMGLPILALIVLPIVGYFLMRADYKVFAIITTGLPAIVVAFAVYITISQGRNS